ncbi:MAG: hypothetical protein IMX00_03375 [Limnochordales bacterium]|nr:hypothetical protein [Limnochordales bacterium]
MDLPQTPQTPSSPRWMNWVKEVITLLGISWQEEEPGVLRVVLKDEEARLFGLGRQQSLLWILDPEKIGTFPQAELVVPGSMRFTQLQEIARRRSRLTRLFLDPSKLTGTAAISDAADSQGGMNQTSATLPDFGGRDASWRLAPAAVVFLLIERVWREPTGPSNLLVNVGVDLLSGATLVNAWERWRSLPWQETAPPWPPRERRQLSYREAFNRATAAARQLLAELFAVNEPGWVAQEVQRYEEATEQVHRYFDGLAREERALRREEERQFHLEEAARLHPLTLDGRPVSLLLLFRPLLIQASSSPVLSSLEPQPSPGEVVLAGIPPVPFTSSLPRPAQAACQGQPTLRPTAPPQHLAILWDPLHAGLT